MKLNKETQERACICEDVTAKQVEEHYGYTKIASKRGYWKNDKETLNRLSNLPEVLDPKKKFRVTFDYDPKFPRALLQVFEDYDPEYSRALLQVFED